MILENRRNKMRGLNKKIAFRIELLYRWTNTEDGSAELVSRLVVLLRENFEDTQAEAEDFLHDCDSLFRDREGVIIEQVPIKVVSVTQRPNVGADWMVESALADYGYEAGVIRHQGSQFAPEFSPEGLFTGTYVNPGSTATEKLITDGVQIPTPRLESFKAFKDMAASKLEDMSSWRTDNILTWRATVERFKTEFGDELSHRDREFLKDDAPCVLIKGIAYLAGLEKADRWMREPGRRTNDRSNLRGAINATFEDIGLKRAGLSASDIAASRRKLISDYEDFIARANERFGTNVTF